MTINKDKPSLIFGGEETLCDDEFTIEDFKNSLLNVKVAVLEEKLKIAISGLNLILNGNGRIQTTLLNKYRNIADKTLKQIEEIE